MPLDYHLGSIDRDQAKASRVKRSMNGVRALLGLKSRTQSREKQPLTPSSLAMTLTAEFTEKTETNVVTMLQPEFGFLPHYGYFVSAANNNVCTAYVHYEPKSKLVELGTNPKTRHAKTVRISVDHYAWLIRQLEEECLVHDTLKTMQHGTASLMPCSLSFTGWGTFMRLFHAAPAPMLAFFTEESPRRLLQRWVHRYHTLRNYSYHHYHQSRSQPRPQSRNQRQHFPLTLLLPKSLLLHTATYIPITKPLPALSEHPVSPTPDHPFDLLSDTLYQTCRRYAQYVALAAHDLVFEDGAPAEFVCRKCKEGMRLQPIMMGTPGIQVTGPSSTLVDRDDRYTFPISYVAPLWGTTDTSQPLHKPSRRRTLEGHTFPPHLKDTRDMQYEWRQSSSSSTHSIKESDHGYVAIDDDHHEIIVAFPGPAPSDPFFKDASFAAVPWQEDTPTSSTGERRSTASSFRSQSRRRRPVSTHSFSKRRRSSKEDHYTHDDDAQWVLECAALAWRRCELDVATCLMHADRRAPKSYRVVIVGHSIGGAVAALCASAFTSTGLLVDREVTLCSVHAPRVGSFSFVQRLQESINTIRVTTANDLLEHVPPRTSGLLHVGQTTVLDTAVTQAEPVLASECGLVLVSDWPGQAEDQIQTTFQPLKHYTMEDHHSLWRVRLGTHACTQKEKRTYII
ncbi:hypothetical protein BCR43DRAFT_271854 [Syncephalastrum racemosum]|uniref:Fungal lipase-type domain-containing protein n=1 Tax=Syncephalastrum racemosum TaxID=13706 RepID=A0A1X2HD96_SYNRA|nr:hypothetical protein BCR43DRAFT_271854 [Syncephalastrum racemosum]